MRSAMQGIQEGMQAAHLGVEAASQAAQQSLEAASQGGSRAYWPQVRRHGRPPSLVS